MSNPSVRRVCLEPAYRSGPNGELWVEKVPLSAIAADFGTPTYIYSKDYICSAFDSYLEALSGMPSLVCVAIKANSNLSLLKLLAARGAGFDIVSGGELERVRC